METNLLIKNTLESSLKSFNDFVLFNMNLMVEQRLPPFIQTPPSPPTTIVQPHPEVPTLAITVDLVLVPPHLPPKSPPPIPQPLSTKG